MAEFLDYSGLTRYDGKVKEYVLQHHLLRKQYDLTKEGAVDSDIVVASKSYDSTEGRWKFSGDCTITLPRQATVYIYISIAKKSDNADIVIGPTHYNTNYIYARVTDSNTVTIKFNGDFWLNYIRIEENSYKIPTKTSELENDAKFVTANVSGSTLVVNDGTFTFS